MTMMRMKMMRKLTSVMFLRLFSVMLTHCSETRARAWGARGLDETHKNSPQYVYETFKNLPQCLDDTVCKFYMSEIYYNRLQY